MPYSSKPHRRPKDQGSPCPPRVEALKVNTTDKGNPIISVASTGQVLPGIQQARAKQQSNAKQAQQQASSNGKRQSKQGSRQHARSNGKQGKQSRATGKQQHRGQQG